MPRWDWRGQASYGLFADGRYRLCSDSTWTLPRCVRASWRHRAFATSQQAAQSADTDWGHTVVWLGSLTEDNENASGSLYRRNRYLDPTSGQFTQEDPIGLAGGLNLYGFASGDPVTFNDPFGLKADSSVFTRAWSELKAGVRQWWRDATDMGQAEDFLDAAAFLPVIGVAGRAAGAAEEASAARGLIDRIAAKLTRIASHLKRSDLSGAAQELRGVPTGFDHVTEVRDAAQGMRNQIARLNRLLGNPNLSAENRGPLEALLGRASRALDAAERALRQ